MRSFQGIKKPIDVDRLHKYLKFPIGAEGWESSHPRAHKASQFKGKKLLSRRQNVVLQCTNFFFLSRNWRFRY